MNGPWAYFTSEEVQGLQGNLPAMLDQARGIAGIPFIITSGYRTPDQEAALKGGVSQSAHCLGLAVDLACSDDHSLQLMLKGLLAAGFARIGIYHDGKFQPTHLHADIGPAPQFAQQTIWILPEKN
jgi:zinc D-Ala-D-Ala carboxypeptidase